MIFFLLRTRWEIGRAKIRSKTHIIIVVYLQSCRKRINSTYDLCYKHSSRYTNFLPVDTYIPIRGKCIYLLVYNIQVNKYRYMHLTCTHTHWPTTREIQLLTVAHVYITLHTCENLSQTHTDLCEAVSDVGKYIGKYIDAQHVYTTTRYICYNSAMVGIIINKKRNAAKSCLL